MTNAPTPQLSLPTYFIPTNTYQQLGIWASRRMTTLRAFSYIIAQLIGGITGAALARSISIKMFKGVHGGTNFVAAGVSTGSAFWIELLGKDRRTPVSLG